MIQKMIKKGEINKKSTFEFIVSILDYIYQEFKAIPLDIITEINLRYAKLNNNRPKRILAVWDFNQRLSKMGDFILCLETLAILREELQLTEEKNIDFCFIDDPKHNNANQLRFSQTYKFKKSLMVLPIISPFVNSIHKFSSNEDFNNFFKQNREAYIRWPPTVSWSHIADLRRIKKTYLKLKKIPPLSVPEDVLNEVYNFYEKEVFPAMPIVMTIRKNTRSTLRNSDIGVIKDFLMHYLDDKRYKFIIVCNKEEFLPELRKFKNLRYSKDYFDGVEYDFGLIQSSYATLFARSGMSVFGWFSDIPFIEYGDYDGVNKTNGFSKGEKPIFAKSYHLWKENEVSSDELISAFEELITIIRNGGVNNTRDQIKNRNNKYEAQF